ncbi:patatin-like phospholipase family protein [Nocardioides bruguierae]|uniref:patatin-like phospholipase family protein n=1 Tax=Nocardioides bruguierae TaxID=2945102 RepID=UPI0020207B9F|nr:patatin-like phospholipase family protein [Nocardioides bruguierae]MCL8026664.1 patatin-like phospholipase family protein [Nocardioides bruguierae]
MPTKPATDPAQRTVALVLDAGGARSAYQVGALEVLLPELERRDLRPTVLIGTSAGALLSAALAGVAHLPADEQARGLRAVLEGAVKKNVMRPIWRQAPEVLLRYASETVGLSGFRLRGFLGTQPLARTLGRSIDWDRVHENVESGLVSALAVTATAVRTGRVTLFAQTAPAAVGGPEALPALDEAHNRAYVPARLGVEHLLASSAIPVLFPSVRVREPAEAEGWYVDGATRRRNPLVPVLELGADAVVAVGTGSMRPPAADTDADQRPVDLGDGGATLLGAVMDDPLRQDVRRVRETNAMLADEEVATALAGYRERQGLAPLRPLPHVALAPERGDELADVAMEVYRANHGSLRGTAADPDLQMVHRLLGSDSPLQGELLSYLLFDTDFFDAAAALGKRDAEAWVAEHPDLWAL